MNDELVFENYQPQNIIIDGGGSVIGLTTVLVNGVDVTEGSVAYVVVPTKLSELQNDEGFISNETDPTVPYYVKQISQADILRWNNKQNELVSGSNIKTINNESILGSGNLEVDTTYQAGTGISIVGDTISNTITSYNALSDLPTIPSKTSELQNDSNYVTSNELSEVAFNGSYNALSDTPIIPSETSELVNNGEDGVNPYITGLDLDYLYSIVNQLPKVTGSGESVTLDNTIQAKMNISLSPSDTTQFTTTGKQLLNLLDGTYNGDNGCTAVVSNGEITLNGTASANSVIYIDNTISLEAVQYTWSANNSVANSNVVIRFGTNIMAEDLSVVNRTKTATLSESSSTKLCVRITGGTTLTNFKLKPQMQTGATASEWEPYTGGIPAPSPSFPQDIHVVSGDNEVKVSNDNVFEITDILANASDVVDNGNGSYTFKSTTAMYNTTTSLRFIASERLTISYKITNGTGANFRFRWVYEDGYIADTTGSGTGTSEVSITNISAPLNDHGKVVGLRGNWTTIGTFTIKDFMLNIGTTALDYTPHEEQIQPITLGVENLLPINQITSQTINDLTITNLNDGTIKVNGTSNTTTRIDVSYTKQLKANTTYTFKNYNLRGNPNANVNIQDSGGNVLANITLNNATVTYTPTANVTIALMRFYIDSNQAFSDYILKVQLEEGTKTNSFTPYGVKPIEMCKIGDYEDEFYLASDSDTGLESGKWYLKKNNIKDVYSSSDGWSSTEAYEGYYRFLLRDSYNHPNNNALCNRLINRGSTAHGGYEYIYYQANSTSVYIQLLQSRLTDGTTTSLNTFLSSNNVIAYHPLATPTYTLLNDTLQTQLNNIKDKLLSYNGQTNISQVNNGRPFVIGASALLDLNSLV